MKPGLIAVTGGGFALVGALARSCNDALPQYWCGPATQAFGDAAHAHCPGCGLMEMGVLMLALAATLLATRNARRIRTRARAR